MGENFFDSLKGNAKIEPKKEVKEFILEEPKVQRKNKYEEYLKNQDCYEDAWLRENQKEEEFLAAKEEREQIVRELQDCREQKNRLEQEYRDKKKEAPGNAQKRWEQIRGERLADIEYQKQAAFEHAESKKQVCEENKEAALADIESKIMECQNAFLRLEGMDTIEIPAMLEEKAAELRNLRYEEQELKSGRKKVDSQFNRWKPDMKIFLLQLMIGGVFVIVMLLLRIYIAAELDKAMPGALCKPAQYVAIGICYCGGIGYLVRAAMFLFRDGSRWIRKSITVFVIFLILLNASDDIVYYIVYGDLSIGVMLSNLLIVWGVTVLLKTLLIEPVYKRWLNKSAWNTYLESLQEQIEAVEAEERRRVWELQKMQADRANLIAGERAKIKKAIEEWGNRKWEIQEKEKQEKEKIDFEFHEEWKEIDNRKYDIPTIPDINDENNYLEEDKISLGFLEQERERLESTIGHLNKEWEERGMQMQKAKAECDNIRAEVDYYGKELKAWLSDEEGCFPKLDEKTILFSQQICIRNYEDPENGYPQIIRHNMHPIIFKYAKRADWEEEGAIHLISEIWKGFTKMIPAELLDFSVIDPSGLIKGKIGNPSERRKEFFRAYQKGFAVREEIKNGVKGLFEEIDIAKLDKEIEKEQDDIQEYARINYEAVLKAKQDYEEALGGPVTPIQQVNISLLKNKAPKKPYHVVFIVVPNENEKRKGGAKTDNVLGLQQMKNLLERDNYADFGFLPIFLVSERETENGENWNDLIERAEQNNGIIYQADLRDLKLAEQRE